MKLWKCPKCGSGVRAPERPRMDDVRRYCLTCSEKTGRLVHRTCPALDRVRERKAEARKVGAARAAARSKAKRQKARAAKSERLVVAGVDIAREWEKLLKATRAREQARQLCHRTPYLDNVRIRRKDTTYSSGRAWWRRGRVVLTLGPDDRSAGIRAVLAHELAHVIADRRVGGSVHHGPLFWDVLGEVLEKTYGPEAYVVCTNGDQYAKHQAVINHLERIGL